MEYEGKSIGDYKAMIIRRKGVLLTAMTVITVLSVYVAYSIPAMYRSTSRFLIEQQDIPQDVVQSTVTSYVDEQIQEVRQRVMSSSNLARLIQDHYLYPELIESGQSQAALDSIRENTLLETEVYDVVNPRSGRAMLATISFTLSFDYFDPVIAQKVAAELANLYLKENVESRTTQVQETLEFILSDIERQTEDVEQTGELLAAFKERNLGNLPELMSYNLQTIERAERQIDDIDSEIRAARNRKLQFAAELTRLGAETTVYDEEGAPLLNPTEQLATLQREKMRLISVYSPEHPDVISIQKEIDILSTIVNEGGATVADLQTQVDAARVNLAQMMRRYSVTHPDVVRAQRSLDNLETELAAAISSGDVFYDVSAIPDSPYARQLKARIDSEESGIRSLNRRKTELEMKVRDLEEKVALSPQIEREYELLRRNNEVAIANLNNARAKFEEAQKAEKLESGGSGDRFTIIENADFPLEPFMPNRTAIILLGFVLACGAGLVLVTILDTLDETVKNSRDVMRLIDTPPLAVIPYLETETEARKRVRTSIGMGVMVMGGVVIAIFISITMG